MRISKYLTGGALAVALALGAAGIALSGHHQEKPRWPDGKKAALALTYDDALDSHLDYVYPALEEAGFRGTFYLTLERPAFTERMDEWRQVAADGHELGNHTLHHPCMGDKPGREQWVDPGFDVNVSYTQNRIYREVALTNAILKDLDGKDSRTFAYPCGEFKVQGESYIDTIAPLVSAGRGVEGAPSRIDAGEIDVMRIATWGPDQNSGAELIAYAEDVLASGGLGTFTFHGMDGDYLWVTQEAHDELLAWLKEHEDEIWIDSLENIVAWETARLEADND